MRNRNALKIIILLVVSTVLALVFRGTYQALLIPEDIISPPLTPLATKESTEPAHFITLPTPEITRRTILEPPVAELAERITKKPFGILVTPENSPISPERFTGWHTGIDVEYEDVIATVPVSAIAKGHVLQARTVSGYGGAIVVQHELDGQPVVGLYGHLEPSSLMAQGAAVIAGQQLGILGESGSAATDGERKHLHFSLKPGTAVDFRGYVVTEDELATWLNPANLF
jgi:murein DD-endopeptidase MepM/ murein hydrolase activator NlpD